MARTLELEQIPRGRWLRAAAEAALWVSLRRRAARLAGRGQWPALNGQALRRETIVRLLHSFRPDVIVETGTYFGSSTAFFSSLGAPVLSVDALPRHHLMARIRLRSHDRVTLALGDSRAFLRHLAAGGSGDFSRPFLYLDAHGAGELPLREELEIAWNRWDDSLVAIDDFMVPGDPGFAYDDYGPGRRIDLEHCSPPAGIATFFPAHGALEETGDRKGTAYMGKGEAALRSLRAAEEAGLLARHTGGI